MRTWKTLFALATMLMFRAAFADGEQQMAVIGDLTLTSGQILQDCHVGYRTYGKLDEKGDNAVLIPSWFLGKSGDMGGLVHPGSLVDSTKYFVIAVDSLGNGVSTSPSNSLTQPQDAYPAITIHDMVESEHRLLTGLGIQHLHAVIGISMAGFQAFEWMTAYPDFADKVIPIVGSPKPTKRDRLLMGTALKAGRKSVKSKLGRELVLPTLTKMLRPYACSFWTHINQANYQAQNAGQDEVDKNVQEFQDGLKNMDMHDVIADLDASYNNDALKAFGDDEATAAAAVHAKVLIIAASRDLSVEPSPALSFAKALNAQTLVLDDKIGHFSPFVEMPRVSAAIDAFLAAP